jgi:hypothetical protein
MVTTEITNHGQRRNRRAVVVGLLVLALLLLYLVSCDSRIRGALDGHGEAGLDEVSFAIGGNTTEAFSPGRMVGLDLEMTNPHDVPMMVTDLAITVRAVSAPRADRAHPCSVADFAVEQPRGGLPLTVPARTTTSFSSLGVEEGLWPRVGMLDRPVNQDGCKAASLTLVYSGSGTLTSR